MTLDDPGLLKAARAALADASRIVFFTGAGMSADSGIPTFRDALTGLWERFDPMLLASTEGYAADPALVWGWYEWRRQKVMQAEPNAGHRAIADFALRQRPRRVQVITQNVDDLHERAGSADVVHLHGSILAPRCFRCGTAASAGLVAAVPNEPEGGRRLTPPSCAACGGAMRPGVVWFGEALPDAEFDRATDLARGADAFVVVGTSGVVEPAASLVRLARREGANIIVVDPNANAALRDAQHWLGGTAAQVLPQLLA